MIIDVIIDLYNSKNVYNVDNISFNCIPLQVHAIIMNINVVTSIILLLPSHDVSLYHIMFVFVPYSYWCIAYCANKYRHTHKYICTNFLPYRCHIGSSFWKVSFIVVFVFCYTCVSYLCSASYSYDMILILITYKFADALSFSLICMNAFVDTHVCVFGSCHLVLWRKLIT